MPAAIIKDQPNHNSAHTNRLMISGNKNCPLETNALIKILAVQVSVEKLHQTGISACIEKTVCHSRQKAKNISDNDVIGVQDAKKDGHIAAHPSMIKGRRPKRLDNNWKSKTLNRPMPSDEITIETPAALVCQSVSSEAIFRLIKMTPIPCTR